ncbi:MAG TPA: CpsD/CapB family tyrosine-protein kinase [Gaiellaceae bacterium]|jgi:capsular exopolysaccharide synthesis family protein
MSQRSFIEPDSRAAESFRGLRLAIEARGGARENRSIVFTSARPREGRTTVAVNYAVLTAFVQRPVLLIDADMRQPSLHEVFGLPRAAGLVDALRDRLDPSQVATSFPSLGGLHVITAGSPLPRPGDIAASAAMARLLERAREEYAAVVLDSPPLLVASDASSLASQPGTAAVVVINPRTRKRQATGALRKLALPEANVLGIVVNRAGASSADLY